MLFHHIVESQFDFVRCYSVYLLRLLNILLRAARALRAFAHNLLYSTVRLSTLPDAVLFNAIVLSSLFFFFVFFNYQIFFVLNKLVEYCLCRILVNTKHIGKNKVVFYLVGRQKCIGTHQLQAERQN